LTLVVTIQYVVVVLSLDSHGEGGTMALAAQIMESNAWPWLKSMALGASIVGTGFVLGDGCLTPAISVVSAIEGIAVYEESLVTAVVPISCIILFFLFMSQRFGTAKIGFLFGPIIVLWFLSIGAIGIWKQVVSSDGAGALAWSAWNPAHAVNIFARHGEVGWLALGSVVLSITGVEAMFADLGHFGAGPVRFGWLALAYPCLILNYVGQAAHVLAPEGRADYSKLFYLTVPTDLLWPMIILATLATMIASQALISGAFSLISQAISLDLFPAVRVLHTSKSEEGQIYVPIVNYTLMVVTILLVIAFQRSEAFAHAYGVAVTAVIVLTCVMSTVVMMLRVRRRKWLYYPATLLFGAVTLFIAANFFATNIAKFVSGGWIAILLGGLVVVLMFTWRRGRAWVKEARMITGVLDLEQFIDLHVGEHAGGLVRPPDRIGVFMSSQFDFVPIEFVRYSHFANSLPEIVIFLTIEQLRVPYFPNLRRCQMKFTDHKTQTYWMTVKFGFAEQRRDIRATLLESELFSEIGRQHPKWSETSDDNVNVAFYVGKARIAIDAARALPRRVVASLFKSLQNLQVNTAEHLQLPPDATIEIASVLHI
jgi:KUP system potassium uptake protein